MAQIASGASDASPSTRVKEYLTAVLVPLNFIVFLLTEYFFHRSVLGGRWVRLVDFVICQDPHRNVTSSAPCSHHYLEPPTPITMTIYDSIPDGPGAKPLSDSILLSRFQALSIDKSPEICEEDDILTDDKILAVYQSLFPRPSPPPSSSFVLVIWLTYARFRTAC